MRKDRQRGAIVVEATVALTAFIFAIFTILSIVNICFIQAKMGVALNAAAKEISQYSYFYYAMGVDQLEAQFTEGTEDSQQLATNTIYGVADLMTSLSEAGADYGEGDFESMITNLQNGADNVDSLITQYAEGLADNPKGFILGMGKMALNNLKEEGKVVLAQVLAKTFMQKNLMSTPGDDADAFLRRHRVVGGMDGLDFDYTSFLTFGTSNKIQLVITYDIQVIRLLNLDYAFTIRQCSKTTAWGRGISSIKEAPANTDDPNAPIEDNKTSVWDMGPADRGKAIVEAEKKNYSYTDSGHGFDAYSNDAGKNEFVSIISIDTNGSSYQTSNGIKNRLSTEYNKMYSKVVGADSNLSMKDENGETVTITSDPDSRTYRIRLIIPDNADMDVVAEAVANFEKTHPGAKVSVRQGYGSPTSQAAENEE